MRPRRATRWCLAAMAAGAGVCPANGPALWLPATPDDRRQPSDPPALHALLRPVEAYHGRLPARLLEPPPLGEPPDPETDTAPADPLDALGVHRDAADRRGAWRTAGEWGSLTARVTLLTPEDCQLSPAARPAWKASEKWQMPLAGDLFVFGHLDAAAASVAEGTGRVAGKTGVGYRYEVLSRVSLTLRGATLVEYDAARAEPDRSRLAVELLATCPLAGVLKLEYHGQAAPALALSERDEVTSDVRLLLPVRPNAELHAGVRGSWEAAGNAGEWTGRSALYLGVEWKR